MLKQQSHLQLADNGGSSSGFGSSSSHVGSYGLDGGSRNGFVASGSSKLECSSLRLSCS
jgi:hypothetical protein